MGLFDEFLLLLGARKVVKALEAEEELRIREEEARLERIRAEEERLEQKLEEADEKWRAQVKKQLASNSAYEDLLNKQLNENEEKMKQLMVRVRQLTDGSAEDYDDEWDDLMERIDALQEETDEMWEKLNDLLDEDDELINEL